MNHQELCSNILAGAERLHREVNWCEIFAHLPLKSPLEPHPWCCGEDANWTSARDAQLKYVAITALVLLLLSHSLNLGVNIAPRQVIEMTDAWRVGRPWSVGRLVNRRCMRGWKRAASVFISFRRRRVDIAWIDYESRRRGSCRAHQTNVIRSLPRWQLMADAPVCSLP